MEMATTGSMPASMATRQALSIMPVERASEGARSSVAKQQRRARVGFSSSIGDKLARSWLHVPLTQHHIHATGQLVECFLGNRRLVVGDNAHCGIGVEILTGNERRMAVNPP